MSAMDEGIRLAKRVAAQQGCSRSQAEAWIEAGAVQVDGQAVTDSARRVTPQQLVKVLGHGTLSRTGMTVLLHKPPGMAAAQALSEAWSALSEAPQPLRGLRELWPLHPAASGLSVWSDEPAVARRLTDRERPLEVEWQLTLPMACLAPALAALQALGLRLSLGHERSGVGQWRVVGKGRSVAELPAHLDAMVFAQAQWRRQRLGRLGLAPLGPGQARLRRDTEKF